jgi:hypothetical protein
MTRVEPADKPRPVLLTRAVVQYGFFVLKDQLGEPGDDPVQAIADSRSELVVLGPTRQ